MAETNAQNQESPIDMNDVTRKLGELMVTITVLEKEIRKRDETIKQLQETATKH